MASRDERRMKSTQWEEREREEARGYRLIQRIWTRRRKSAVSASNKATENGKGCQSPAGPIQQPGLLVRLGSDKLDGEVCQEVYFLKRVKAPPLHSLH